MTRLLHISGVLLWYERFERRHFDDGWRGLLGDQDVFLAAVEFLDFGFPSAGVAAIVVGFQEAELPGLAATKVAGAELALGVFPPAPGDVGGDAGVELVVAAADNVNEPVFFTHEPGVAVVGKTLDLEKISAAFREVAAAKQWQAYHTPKNLAAAVAVEAAELLAEFQWLSDAESVHLVQESVIRERVAAEAVDVVMYLVELCRRLEIDLPEAVERKIALNNERFVNSD